MLTSKLMHTLSRPRKELLKRLQRRRLQSFRPRMELLEDRSLLAADLQITKSDSLSAAIPGTLNTYNIVVTNAGPDSVTGAVVADSMPANFTAVTYSATATGGAAGFTASGSGSINDTVTLPSGATITYVAKGFISAAATGTLSNTATITAPLGVTDSDLTNNSATDTDTLTPQADLQITKTDNRAFALPGGAAAYTVVVSNAGPSTVVGATVSDTFPAGFTGATFTATATGGATGFTATGSGTINDTVTLPAGSTITYLVTGTISAAATGTMTNSANVTTPAAVVELDASNNTSVDINTIASVVDLQITKSDSVSTTVAGTQVTYTIVVNNNGSVAVNGASVADLFPATLTNITYTATGVGGATGFTANGSGNITDTVNLPSGSSITYIASGTLSGTATGTLSNTATVATPLGVVDADVTNNASVDADLIVTSADLQITKTDNKNFVQAGAANSYTIVVTNAGPSTVTGATVADTFPSAFTGVTFTATATGGATGFSASGSGNISNTVTLPAGSTITYVVSGTVDASATGTLSNSATVTAPAGVVDVNLTNNTALDADVVGASIDVQITKTDGVPAEVPGTTANYTVVVRNVGSVDVTGAAVADVFPAVLTGVTYTATAVGGATGFTASGGGSIADTVNLPVGSSITYLISGTISASATGTLTNTATVTAAGDVDTTNNSSTDIDVLTTTPVDVSITKSDAVSASVPGESTTYTLVVTNNGPNTATNIVVSDLVPAGAVSFTWSGNGKFNQTGAINDTIVSLASGASVTYTVTAEIDPAATGALSNSATVTAAGDINATNDTAVDVNALTPLTDVSVTKTNNASAAVAGQNTTYTIVVTNAGPSTATNVLVSDPLPLGVTSFTWSGNGLTNQSGAISDTIASLAPGASVTYTVVAAVSASATGVVANNVTVTAAGDVNVLNNADIDIDAVTTTPVDVSVTKTDSLATAVAGEIVNYTITVSNAGPNAATNVAVLDVLPVGVTAFSWSGNGLVNQSGAINNTIATLAAGASVTYTVAATVSPSATGTLSNTVTVTAAGDINSLNDVATDIDALTSEVDVGVTKTDSAATVVAGQTTTYSIVVTNAGPSTATNIVVADTLPTGVTGFSWSGNGLINQTGAINNTIASLAPGASVTYTVVASVDPAATGSVTNSVSVTAAGDTNTGNNSASDTDTVTTQVDVGVTKSDNAATVVAGQTTTYSVVVTNSGPSTATNVVVADALPTGVTNFSWSGNGLVNQSGAINNTITSLAPGASVTYTVVASVDPAATGSVTNAVTATAAGDTNAANNSASDTDTVTSQVDVGVTKTDGVASVAAGGSTTYSVVVTNSGPSTATNVVVADVLPTGVTAFSWSGNGLVNQSGAINNTITSLAPGASVTYTVVASVSASASGSITNTASVTAAGDTNAANDSASDTDTVTTQQGQIDVSVTKTDSVTTVNAGATTTYTVVVTNIGTSAATNVVVADALPTGVTSFTWSGNGLVNQTGAINNTITTLAPGASVTYTIAAAVSASATGTINNAVTATAAGDVNTANNTATDIDNVIVVQDGVDLNVTKTDSVDPVIAGSGSGNLSYVITVTNVGSVDATGVVVSEDLTLPAGVSVVSITPDVGTFSTTTAPDGTWDVGSLAVGESATLTVLLTAGISAVNGAEISNTATVTAANETLINTSDDTFTESTLIENLGPGTIACEVLTSNLPGAAGSAVLGDDLDNPGAAAVVVTGTSGNDVIIVEPRFGTPGQFRVRLNGRIIGNFSSTEVQHVVVFGQAGNDTIIMNALLTQSGTLFGGAGNDFLQGARGNDGLDGGAGNDHAFGGLGEDIVCGGIGNDFVYGQSGADLVGGDEGNDFVFGEGGQDVLLGGDGNDNVYGGLADDQIDGGTGNDKLFGEAGNDLVLAGDGNDWVYGGSGNDRLYGQAGNDQMFGEGGNDLMLGGEGQDTMYGGAGRDVMIGGLLQDRLFGEGDDDILIGGTTASDDDDAALAEIMAEWSSSNSFADRIANLEPVLNDATVTDFGGRDFISGGAGRDWYLDFLLADNFVGFDSNATFGDRKN